MKTTLLECLRPAGEILLRYFGQALNIRNKGNQSNIVTDADVAAEQSIVGRLRERFPDHSIIAEETGYHRGASEFTWVIDPLDGTSNFASGLPWFGVQVAVLKNRTPILAGMYLPLTRTLYFAEEGQGVFRDETPVRVTAQTDPLKVLCSVGLDAGASAEETRRQIEILQRLANAVRNFRATNCLLDFGFTIDGRLGGCLNFNTKIWDIAPLALMLPEAGGRLTDIDGSGIVFRPDLEPFDRNYAVLGASLALHAKLLELIRPGSRARAGAGRAKADSHE